MDITNAYTSVFSDMRWNVLNLFNELLNVVNVENFFFSVVALTFQHILKRRRLALFFHPSQDLGVGMYGMEFRERIL